MHSHVWEESNGNEDVVSVVIMDVYKETRAFFLPEKIVYIIEISLCFPLCQVS